MQFIGEFITTVNLAADLLLQMSDELVSKKTSPDKWSKKEMLGHLIDSASNNHKRFVLAQYKDDLIFEGYEQDKWVEAQKYNKSDWILLVNLWQNFNNHIVHVMKNTTFEVLTRKHSKHNLHKIAWEAVPENEETSLEYFYKDYINHLKHHLNQIFKDIDN
jgi:hypothetical protein